MHVDDPKEKQESKGRHSTTKEKKMDKLVRKIEIPLAKQVIEKAGLYIVQKKI